MVAQVALAVKILLANAGDLRDAGSVPVSARSPGGGSGNPFQYSCLENLMDRDSLAGYSPWGHKELDMTVHMHKGFTLISSFNLNYFIKVLASNIVTLSIKALT